MSSQKIIEGFRTNDSRLLGLIYQSQFPKLKRYVIANNGDEDQAKDVFQEAFVIAWENIKKGIFIPKSNSEVNGYLYRVAKNKWLDYVRSAVYKKSETLQIQHDKMETVREDKEKELQLIENGLNSLGDRCRDILKRFYYRKESMANIADAFGWTEQTARNNKYRCIQKLRNEMDRLNIG